MKEKIITALLVLITSLLFVGGMTIVFRYEIKCAPPVEKQKSNYDICVEQGGIPVKGSVTGAFRDCIFK